MSDISGASNTAGQSATAKRSTGYSSPLSQTVGKGEDSASIGASEPTPSGALGRDVTENPTRALDKQLSAGAAFLEEASKSLRAAAAKLDERLSPLAHGLRSAARAGDDLAEQVRTRSPAELLDGGSNYARQRPLLVFGAAAGVGLLLSRFAKSTGQTGAPPSSDGRHTHAQSTQSRVQTHALQPSETSTSPTL
jgi:ElaB/YqjD/DUF883 family membrane-anchored ribosome-binding protein